MRTPIPAYPDPSDRYAAIKVALRKGNEELAHAIDNERQCPDCGAHVSGQGYVIDPDADCCRTCEP